MFKWHWPATRGLSESPIRMGQGVSRAQRSCRRRRSEAAQLLPPLGRSSPQDPSRRVAVCIQADFKYLG